MLPLPTDIDKQAGDVDLRYSLVEHSAKDMEIEVLQ